MGRNQWNWKRRGETDQSSSGPLSTECARNCEAWKRKGLCPGQSYPSTPSWLWCLPTHRRLGVCTSHCQWAPACPLKWGESQPCKVGRTLSNLFLLGVLSLSPDGSCACASPPYSAHIPAFFGLFHPPLGTSHLLLANNYVHYISFLCSTGVW
jgi:hypothetical protein